MRGVTGFVALALSMAACRQTVVIDLRAVDAGGGTDGGPFCSGPSTSFELESPEVMVALDRSSKDDRSIRRQHALAATRDALDQYAAAYQKSSGSATSDFPGAMTAPFDGQAGCRPRAERSQPQLRGSTWRCTVR